MGTTGPGLITVMRSEGEEAGVVDRLLAVIASHHDIHVVVETSGAQAAEILESTHVFPDRSGKSLVSTNRTYWRRE
jgi:hypothetical protein